MPIRTYEPLNSPCRLCGRGFDLVQASSEPAVSECPKCGQAVRLRTPDRVNSPEILKPPSISDAKAAGFTVLKRTSGGDFEKH
jgi:hypothetical protein